MRLIGEDVFQNLKVWRNIATKNAKQNIREAQEQKKNMEIKMYKTFNKALIQIKTM